MTDEDIVAMARQAGFSEWSVQTPNDLITFAKLVAHRERTDCADYVEEFGDGDPIYTWCVADHIRLKGMM